MTDYFHAHNLVDPATAGRDRPFGIRATLPATDPMTRLIGSDWTQDLWFASKAERDTALEKMRKRHGYYREGDEVSVIYEPIDSGN